MVVLSLAPTHMSGRARLKARTSQGPYQTIHWLTGVSIKAQHVQNQAEVHKFNANVHKIGNVSRAFLIQRDANRRFHW